MWIPKRLKRENRCGFVMTHDYRIDRLTDDRTGRFSKVWAAEHSEQGVIVSVWGSKVFGLAPGIEPQSRTWWGGDGDSGAKWFGACLNSSWAGPHRGLFGSRHCGWLNRYIFKIDSIIANGTNIWSSLRPVGEALFGFRSPLIIEMIWFIHTSAVFYRN